MGLSKRGLSTGGLRNTYLEGAIHQYDAKKLDLNDGDDVTLWEDFLGDVDLDDTKGSVVYRDSGTNGHPSVEFEGSTTEDSIANSTGDVGIEPPYSIAYVGELLNTRSDDDMLMYSDPNRNIRYDVNNGNDNRQTHSVVDDAYTHSEGSATQPYLVISTFDPPDVVFRVNGTEYSYTVDTEATATQVILGSDRAGSDRGMLGYANELTVYKQALDNSQFRIEERRLADKWDISI